MRKPRRGSIASVAVCWILIASAGLGVVPALAAGGGSPAHGAPASNAAVPHIDLAKITGLIHHRGVRGAVNHANSSNWAGYADTVGSGAYGKIQEVTAGWYTPAVSCASAPSGGSIQVSWVGIDGDGTSSVEQDGTLSYCSTTGATPAYYDWWEFYPYNSLQLVSTINANDAVQAYVLYNAGYCVGSVCGLYTLQLTDFTAGTYFTVTGGGWICNSSSVCEGGLDGSAECISEAPGTGTGISPVSKYTNTTFYGCADSIGTTFQGIGNWSATSHVTIWELNQVGASTHTDQKTGPLSTWLYYGKAKFTVYWLRYS